MVDRLVEIVLVIKFFSTCFLFLVVFFFFSLILLFLSGCWPEYTIYICIYLSGDSMFFKRVGVDVKSKYCFILILFIFPIYRCKFRFLNFIYVYVCVYEFHICVCICAYVLFCVWGRDRKKSRDSGKK